MNIRLNARKPVVSLGRAKVSPGSFGFALLHSGTQVLSCSIGLVCVNRAHQVVAGRFAKVHSGAPRGRRVHSCSREFTRVRVAVAGLIQVRECRAAPRDYRVHSGSRGFTRARKFVAGFIWDLVGSLCHSYVLPGSFMLVWVY